MKNSHASRSVSDEPFPTFQLFILSICRLAEPIALTSIFPYAWLMVRGFHIGTEDDASFYAGFLISAFSLCEAASGMFWGSLSDRIGRKPVMVMSCIGTLICLLMTGFAKSFSFCLIGRALGGLLNGSMGVVQTIVGEIVKNPAHEPKAFAIMPFVWSVGTILGPAIGGTFADPVRGYPSVFPKGGLFEEYPWALPNIICSVIMLCSLILVVFCLEETHPDHCKGADPNVHHPVTETTPMIVGGNNAADQSVNLHDDHDTYGTFNEAEVTHRDSWKVRPDGTSRTSSLSERQVDKWFTWKVSSIVIALGIYTYHSMCYDHLFPIFLQDSPGIELNIFAARSSLFHMEGGLGLSTKMVGLIMTVGGVIALFIQAVIFPFVADRLGVFRTFMMVTLLHPIVFFIVPYLVFLPSDLLMVGIYVCLTIRHFFSILNYPSVLILLKQACPSPRYLGKINGLAASVGAACRMVAPPVAGLLYTKGRQIEFTGLAWFGAGAVAILGAFQVFSVPRDRADGAVVHSWTRRLSNAAIEDGNVPREVVNITVYDEDSDGERQR